MASFELVNAIRGQRDLTQYKQLQNFEDLVGRLFMNKDGIILEDFRKRLEKFFEENGIKITDIYIHRSMMFPLDGFMLIKIDNVFMNFLATVFDEVDLYFKMLKTQIKHFKEVELYDKVSFIGCSNLRVDNFLNNYKRFEKEKAKELLLSVYTSMDNDFYRLHEPIQELLEKGSCTKDLMLTKLVDNRGCITIYRGENEYSSSIEDAYSWTLSEEKAKWFMNRFKTDYIELYKAKIKIENIRAFINTSEKEVIVDYKDLKEIMYKSDTWKLIK